VLRFNGFLDNESVNIMFYVFMSGWFNSFVLSFPYFFRQIPDNGLNHLPERLLLFRHDYGSSNVLHIINSAAEIVDETLVEIVLTAGRKLPTRI
jgi:hypothetical protein